MRDSRVPVPSRFTPLALPLYAEGGQKSIAERRKNTTSTEVKRRYNDKVYSKIQAELPKDTVSAFREKCKNKHISQASVLLDAIEKFLRDG